MKQMFSDHRDGLRSRLALVTLYASFSGFAQVDPVASEVNYDRETLLLTSLVALQNNQMNGAVFKLKNGY